MEQKFYSAAFLSDFVATRQKIQVLADSLDSARQAIKQRLDEIFGFEQYSILNVFEAEPDPINMTPETQELFHQSIVERRERLKLAKKEEDRKRVIQNRQKNITRREREANDRQQLREQQRQRKLAKRIG